MVDKTRKKKLMGKVKFEKMFVVGGKSSKNVRAKII